MEMKKIALLGMMAALSFPPGNTYAMEGGDGNPALNIISKLAKSTPVQMAVMAAATSLLTGQYFKRIISHLDEGGLASDEALKAAEARIQALEHEAGRNAKSTQALWEGANNADQERKALAALHPEVENVVSPNVWHNTMLRERGFNRGDFENTEARGYFRPTLPQFPFNGEL